MKQGVSLRARVHRDESPKKGVLGIDAVASLPASEGSYSGLASRRHRWVVLGAALWLILCIALGAAFVSEMTVETMWLRSQNRVGT
jgi:hypothetical protein